MREFFKFFNEVKSELQRVTWPSSEEFFQMLVAVGVVVFFFSVVLAGMDFGFSFLLKKLMS
ncbi:preprotein translocase subunit SecE [Candidatus Dependentiae bacterium]|nr:preprotein translocase subunit SecE [Candidatus Dependentiae bacterium]